MKTFLAILGLALTPALALADDLSGTWKVHVDAHGRAVSLDCHFAQKDRSIGGTCARPQDGEPPVPFTGTLTGLNARWVYDGLIDGRREHIAFNGNVEGTTISGEADYNGTRATFEAVKQ